MLIGICAGVKAKVKLGDVLIATEIIDYEGVRREPTGDRKRWNREATDWSVVMDLSDYEEDRLSASPWLDELKATLDRKYKPIRESEGNLSPIVHRGIMACGEKLIVDGSLIVMKDEYDERIRGVDMESYGFASECKRRSQKVPWLVVKGISDYGEPRLTEEGVTSQAEKGDDWQGYAALAASACAVGFLREEYRPEASPPDEDLGEPF